MHDTLYGGGKAKGAYSRASAGEIAEEADHTMRRALSRVRHRVEQRVRNLDGMLLIARLERIEGLRGEAGAMLMQKR